MAKVITFSRTFPSYHPKAGQPTYFVEKFYNSLFSRNNLMDYPKEMKAIIIMVIIFALWIWYEFKNAPNIDDFD